MALLLTQIPEKIKAPEKRATISQANKHEKRLRFHTETYLDRSQISQPLTEFLDWVAKLLPKDKYKIFVQLFRFPTQMIDLTTKIYNELQKVFDGRNSAINFQFRDSETKEDWEIYRKEELNEPRVWREKGWEVLQTSVNSMVVVDMPQEQTSDRPEPYFYFLDIKRVIDYGYKSKGKFEYVIFRIKEDVIACYDDENYRILKLNKKGEIEEILIDQKHDLGYCPIQWFWDDSIASNIPDIKKNPITPQLANYDWSLFFGISKRHLDLYAAYPIYSAYEADCDFMNNETGDYCDGSFLRDDKNQYIVDREGIVRQCPICAEKRIVGAGSFIDVPIPTNDSKDLSDPINVTTIDADSLDYNKSEVTRLRENIYTGVVGSGGDVQQKEAINETQVHANYEEKTTVLQNLKVNFEKIITFTNDTVCRLRYGTDYLGMSYNMGTEFYIYSVEDLYAKFKQAKENGANESELNAISEQIIATEYRNNPTQMKRMMFLKELEPYNNYTREELLSLQDKNLVDTELMQIKINFNSFVERFERENINIMEFGSLLSLDKKIEIIIKKLKEYVTIKNIKPVTSGSESQAN